MSSADPLAVSLGGERTGGVRVEWDADQLRTLSDGTAASAPGLWRLDGEIDWDAVSGLRIVSAAFEDGGLLALAALRPAGAAGHDADSVRAIVVEPGGGVGVEVERPLLSTEYDAAGGVARIGIELHIDPETTPLRVSAERRDESDQPDSERTTMTFRMKGRRGTGILELVGPG